jgi:hypothetical protein
MRGGRRHRRLAGHFQQHAGIFNRIHRDTVIPIIADDQTLQTRTSSWSNSGIRVADGAVLCGLNQDTITLADW